MLQTGNSYTGAVKSVTNNIDSFPSRLGGGLIMYCHRVIMNINDVDIPCQYCCADQNQREFIPGEIITIFVKSFTKGEPNIRREVEQPVANPDVEGTVAERALHYAVLFNQYKPVSDAENVIRDATRFVDWLIKQNNGGK